MQVVCMCGGQGQEVDQAPRHHFGIIVSKHTYSLLMFRVLKHRNAGM
jgi:hypothetical protein